MPELPEVETIRLGLAGHVLGARVDSVSVLRPYSVRRQAGGEAEFAGLLTGMELAEAARRGKFLWFPLGDSGSALVAHLGMSGQLRLNPIGTPAHSHSRVRLQISGAGGAAQLLDFVDQRTFGFLCVSDLIPTDDGAPGGLGASGAFIPALAAHIARDLADPFLDLPLLVARISTRRSAIKRVLLDQAVVSGVGNIYADEALWRAQVHYAHPADALGARKVRTVLEHARDVMNEALAVGGTSFDALYVNVNGESGYFERGLNAYGRTGKPCHRCGTPIERAAFAGRSSHFCPRCQAQ